jgi:hypothetical protein
MASPAARLAVAERGTEDVLRALLARENVCTRIRDQRRDAGFACNLCHRHRDAGVNGADQNIDLLALYELGGEFGRLRRRGFVVDLDPFDGTAGKLAALLLYVEIHRIGNCSAERGEGAAIGQQKTDAERSALRDRGPCERECRGCGPHACHLQNAAARKS